MENVLKKALDELDTQLSKKEMNIEIVICGAYAIFLMGHIRAEHTLDVDTVKTIDSNIAHQLIQDIGKVMGLSPNWLNDQASTVPLPKGTLSRAKPLQKWNSIKASVVAREDLIKMKASAFSIRRDHTNKDWDDLVLLQPNQKEIEDAIAFVKEVNHPPANAPKKVISEFMETLNDLRKLCK